mmetsp:Transcript_30321/g.37029  ORF Transcript_30321/g.37029 Transcript_30321/m.37029 type:complete len:243 (-) Transcript_30321:163-891(-)|eukprot:CAMPEP_0172503094 /NCGR_PEP_ID=MMETSP1066-20121228/166034_1 /TAXON_ID=671091 /ORGANISM="Coscinodiscus wailesii, Strain CCMP2513" /LENGTH=242 /DNA_ID=CAMNT_0013278683 /DNA_START=197 /DNA_END=925 /DNA_ORIENTATION=-
MSKWKELIRTITLVVPTLLLQSTTGAFIVGPATIETATNHHPGYLPLSATPNSDDPPPVVELTALRRVRVLAYRAALGVSAGLISSQALGGGILDGSGVDIGPLIAQTKEALPFAAGSTAILGPLPSGVSVGPLVSLLGSITVGSGVISTLGIIADAESVGWTLAVLSLMAVSVREIWYFGVEYKQECVLVLLTLVLMLNEEMRIPFVMPLCAVGMAVLAGGKVFEPCEEEFRRSNSEFLGR